MNNSNEGLLIIKGLILIALFIGINGRLFADEALGSAIDCSKVDIDYMDNPELTQSERLEAMNNAFFESVNRFELCNLSSQSASSTSSSSMAGETGAQSGSESESGSEAENTDGNESEETTEGTEGNEAPIESVASSAMTGTEAESTPPPFDSPDESAIIENEIDESISTYYGGANGALPEDIPDVNNDDAVAAQIRLAAEIETDPVKKEKLWNEYRKYKGLPVKK